MFLRNRRGRLHLLFCRRDDVLQAMEDARIGILRVTRSLHLQCCN